MRHVSLLLVALVHQTQLPELDRRAKPAGVLVDGSLANSSYPSIVDDRPFPR